MRESTTTLLLESPSKRLLPLITESSQPASQVRHSFVLLSSGKIHATIIHWYPEQGNLQHFGYNNGRVLVQKSGLYYVYNGVQLIQYVFVERLSYSSTLRTTLLMKSGNTFQWKRGTYHMCCQQQSGVFSLQAGEGLYVSVSNSWMLDPEAEGSYFGAFRVRDLLV
uniref:THD domain-containing protein n=1 Tax=Astyanax mexicanus TaxID=7994 RepID=A0A3B1K575_ASTMX